MKDLKQRMLDILNETAQHYNSNNRSNQDGRCTYIPTDPTKSEGCAIGRKLPKTSKALIAEKGFNGFCVDALIACDIPLGETFEGMSVEFLNRLQSFHDADENWTNEGLSPIGKRELKLFTTEINGGGYE